LSSDDVTTGGRPARAPASVHTIEHAWIPMPDRTRLAARIWLPEDAGTAPVPAIMDFLPYRQGDLMAARDAAIYPYLAARGYACARVDLRGTGNSEGIILDEYTQQELQDGCDVIAWLAAQPWCDGNVGMTGISWGGFNSLQVAALRPRALRAVLTLCASDDRYADDVHYRGGCVFAVDMLQWAVSMLTWNALPPDPAVAGAAWREQWLERLTRTPAFIEPWMSHQLRDAYWRHGSVCEDYAAIELPVYAVGGWSDGYTDAIPRLLAGLAGPRKGLIGPWSHAYPNDSVPGPEIGFLTESLRWWDHWLKGIDTGIMDEPMLRVWMQEYTPPAPYHKDWPGRWVAEPCWPPAEGGSGLARRFYLVASGTGELSDRPGDGEIRSHRAEQTAGLDAGALIADGGFGDWPGDQRAEDGRSLSFTSPPLDEAVEILGNPRVRLLVTSDQPGASVVARLCDVAPTGESLLVTRGLLNLTHRDGHDRVTPLVPGQAAAVELPLKVIAHRFDAGHRIRLSVSTTYWPWIWPHPEPVTLGLNCGEGSFAELPVRSPRAEDEAPVPFAPPERPAGIETEVLARRPTQRVIRHNLSDGSAEVLFDWDVGGNFRLVDAEIEADGSNVTTYRIVAGQPLSAEVHTEQSASLSSEHFNVAVAATGRMSADPATFLVTLDLDARENGHRVHSRQWHLEFPRNGT
jgi:putative CocE/NonD family hydrolase